jgi:hypothetical protein
MGDIETLSTRNNALIVTIGAVKFDADNVLDRFTIGIDPVDAQRRYGRDIDAKTVIDFWFDPKRDAARVELLATPKIDMFSALQGFADWCAETALDDRGSLWGKGATFDNVLLKDAFDAAGLEFPFGYRQNECYRTFANRCPEVEFEPIGTAHVAVADAESQAVHLQRICKHLGVAL